MSNQIKFKRSSVPGRVPTVDDIGPGEIALNTFDGKLFTNQTQGALSRIVEIGGGAAQSVLYVSKSGNDENDGKTLATAKLTIKSALAIATPGTTVFVKSGEYIEDNPLRVPARVAIVGDSLRTVTIRPKNTTEDICWVNNGSYIFQLNFKGHIAPSAAVAFPPDGSAGYIVTSPYVQAVTSITTTGTGMRVDGAVTEGLKSMVVDAFTQYNQGGIGIHMLNRGNTQLVSVFTICCEISFLCENGGFCSITNSNTSFGTFGLISRGTSEPLYYGTTAENVSDNSFVVKNLAKRPNVGDGVLFANYNQETCERDAGLISDSLAFDLLYGGSTQSTFAGLRYWDRGSVQILNEVVQTTGALSHASELIQDFLRNNPVTAHPNNTVPVPTLSTTGTEYAARFVTDEFDTIINIINNGPQADVVIKGPDYDIAESEFRALRLQILEQRASIIQGVTELVANDFPALEYDVATCERDIGLIVDAVADDLCFGSNYKSIIAALSYVNATGGLYIPAEQLPATLAAIDYVKTRVSTIVDEELAAVTLVNSRFDTITSILNGNTAPEPIFPTPDTFLGAVSFNLQQNKNFVAEEAVEFMSQTYPAFTFNTDVCKRDIRYVIDALCYDIVYGGTSQTVRAGQRYYTYSTGSAVQSTEERDYTILAFEYVQQTLERVAINDPIPPLQSPVIYPQYLAGTPATILEAAFIAQTIATINDIIRTGVVGSSGTIVPNGQARTDATTLDNSQIISDVKEFVIADTIAWINDTFPAPGFTYDETTCIRDLDRIIDSVNFDLVHGGNRQSVQSGVYYYGHSADNTIIESQEVQTVGILNFVKTLMEYIVTAVPAPQSWQQVYQQVLDLPPANVSVLSSINDNIDLIKDIIENGPTVAGIVKDSINLTPSADPEVEKAFNLIVNNRDYIKAEVIAYTNKNWSTLSQGTDTFYAVKDVAPLQLGLTAETYPDLSQVDTGLLSVRQALLDDKEQIKTNTIAFLAANFFDNFVFNKIKCYRDVGLILEAVLDDMVLGSNYKSVIAGLSYLRYYTSEVKDNQLEQTLTSINAARDFALERVTVQEARTIITDNFKIITDIIEFGAEAAPTLTFPASGGTDIGSIDGGAVLQSNKEFVKAEVIAFINNNLNPFSYDEEKCARDVGYIIEGLTYDLSTGSNYWAVINGRSYLRANAGAVLVEPQKTATLDAMEYVIKTVNDLISVDSNLQTVFDIVKYGSSNIPEIQYPTTPNMDPNLVAAEIQLAANKAFIVEEIITWIDSNYTGLVYDSDKCARDVGYIIDAVRYDIMFNSNFRSIVAAIAYYRANASDVVGAQKIATLESWRKLKELIAQVVASNATALNRANASMELIIDVFDNGPTSAPAFNLPNPTNITLGTSNAKEQLIDNKQFIINQIIGYINDTFVGFVYNTGVQDKCERDLGIIIDSAAYDLALNTNYNAITAGLSYQRANTSVVQESQQFQTVAGIRKAEELVETSITSPTAQTRFAAAFNTVVDLLKGGTAPSLSLPPIAGAEPAVILASEKLQASKNSIKTQITNYIDSNFVGFNYTTAIETKCERDLDYIIDGAKFDSALDTNYNAVTNGLGYQRANANLVQGEQLIQTVEAIKFAKTQTVSAVDIAVQTAVGASFDEVVDIILNNTPDALVFNNGLSVERTNAKDALQNPTNKSAIQTQVLNWLSLNYPALTFDTAKCSRDVGYIIDGICYDLMYNTNAGSIINADAYFVGAVGQLGAGETTATVAAYEQLAIYINAYVDASLQAQVIDNINIIRAHISANGGTDLQAQLTLPVINETPYATLNSTKATIIDDTSQFIIDNFTLAGQPFSYNSAACSRDVGYIVDALSYDILYGGNSATIRNADAYYVGTQGQLGTSENYITVLAYQQLKTIVTNLVLTPSESTALGTLIDIIINVIENPTFTGGVLDLPAIINPSIATANTALQLDFSNIATAKAQAITDTSTYIIDTFVGFTYDSVKCARDVGFILDALTYDVTYGGNLETIVAARSYFVGVTNDPQYGTGEKIATVEAYRYLSNVVSKVVREVAVSPVFGLVTQDTSGTPANQVAANFLVDRVQDIIETIESDGTLPSVIEPNTDWVSAGLLGANTSLINATNAIKTEIITYINDNFANFNYNPTKCAEDVGYIVDALRHDVLYGGNLAIRNAAQAYFVGTDNQLGDGESSATVAAYTRLQTVVGQVVQALPVSTSGSLTATQTDAGANATATEASTLSDLIEIIKEVVADGDLDDLAAPELPTAINITEDYVDSIQALISNKEIIKTGTINFVNTKERLVYDETLCSRDVGYIIDAVTYDLVFDTTFRSIKVGQAYLRSYAKEVTVDPQRRAILNALETIESEMIAANPIINLANTQTIQNRIALIKDIIETLDGDREFTITAPGFRAEEAYTVDLLEQNREFVLLEVEAYISQNYPRLQYDKVACRRDVNYIIDAISYDISFGGNSQTINAGLAYYSGTTLYLGAGEKLPTLMAYAYMKNVIRDICSSTIIATPLQDAVLQITGGFSYPTIADQAANLVEDIRTIINAIDPVPAIINPSFTWANAQAVFTKTAIDVAKTSIQSAVIDDINSKIYFVYKEASCARDVGYIIDALTYDLIYDGNSQTVQAARSYYDGVGKNVVAGELFETIQAYEHMKAVLQKIIRNRAVAPNAGNTVIQNTLLSPGSQLSVVRITDLMDQLIEIVGKGIEKSPTIIGQDFTQTDDTLNSVRQNILAEKASLQAKTIDYIESRLLTFNKDTCGRDVGLILDAVAYDMVFDSNFQSVTAGNSYLRASASVVKQFQLLPTIRSIDFIKDAALLIAAGNQTAVSRLAAKFEIIKQILIAGTAFSGEIVYPPPSGVNQGTLDAIAAIQANRTFIIEEIFEYVDLNYGYLYDEEKCRRDIGLILNAVLDDIVFGTNFKTITAARSYVRSYASTVTSKQKKKTILGIKKARDLAIAAIVDPITQGQITNLFQIVIDVIESVDPTVVPALSFTNPVGVSSAVVNAANLISGTNKTTLVNDVITWINDTYTNFIYTDEIKAKCERDLDYIFDAARIDAALGTNYNAITAGQAYQRANSSYVTNNQKPQTVGAIEYAKQIAKNAVSSSTYKTAVGAAFDEVLQGLDGGAASALTLPTPSYANLNLVNAKSQLIANRSFIINEVSNWISFKLVGFDYASVQATCERDLGIIIDAVAYDMVLGTNYNSITAGLAYQRANAAVVQESQKIQTRAAIEYARDLVETLVSDATAKARVLSSFNEVLDILKNNTPDDLLFSVPIGVNEQRFYAKEQLVANRSYIQAEIIAYVNANTPPVGYDQAKCSRDVGYIVDALCYDILYGGNSATIRAADAYFVSAASQLGAGETAATVAAYERLKVVVSQIVQGVDITESGIFTEQQVFYPDNVTNAAIALELQSNVDVIIGYITDPIVNILPTPTQPDTAWSEFDSEFDAILDPLTGKEDVIDQTSIFVQSTFDGFSYGATKQSKCERDIGLIVDALCHDILYGGNYASVRAADSYFVGAISQLGAGEALPTFYAYERLQDVISEVVRGQAVTDAYFPGNQTILPGAATAFESVRLRTLVEIIKTVVKAGNLNELAIIEYPDLSLAPSEIEIEYSSLLANKTALINKVSSYITKTYSNFVYDREKCKRDVGYIVDAVGWDMMFGSNFRSIVAGLSYYRANAADVIGIQKDQTLLALQRLKILISANVDTSFLAKTRAETLMDIIISVFDTGVAPATLIPDPTGQSAGTIAARTELTTNKSAVQSAVISYINTVFVPFDYSGSVQTTCERDLGYIIEATAYDGALGTNYNAVTAGNAYRRENASVVIESQQPQTVEGIRYAKEYIKTNITTNDSLVEDAFGEVISALEGNAAADITYPDASLTTADQTAAKDALQAAKSTLQSNLITWINDNFVGFDYDTAQIKCERDLNIIIDASQFDSALGTNYNAITAGLAYQRENTAVVQEAQLIQTVEAIRYARDLVLSEAVDSTYSIRTTSAFNKVVDLLQQNTTSTVLIFPSPTGVDPALESAKNALVANRTNIQNDLISWITNQIATATPGSTFDGFTYDSAKCSRDVGYIVDALCYDILYGGNSATVRAADAYFVGSTSQLGVSETTATVESYEQLKAIIAGYIADPTIDPTINGLLDIIIDYITDPIANPLPVVVNPDITWANSTLQTDFASVDAAQTTIVASTSTFIYNNFDDFTYISASCSRDVGFIIDAVCYDIMYGGNSAAIRNAEAYFVGALSELPANTQYVTVLSYNKLIDDMRAEIATITEQNRVTELVGIIRDVISDNSLSGLPVVVYPVATGIDFNALTTPATITDIITQTSNYIATTFNNFVYDSVKCSRDVGFIIDALVFDLTYGGSLETTVAARSYFVGALNDPQYGDREKIPTEYSYKFLSSYVFDLIQPVDAPSATTLSGLVDNIVEAINDDQVAFEAVEPSTSWVANDLVASYTELIANKPRIQDGVIDYIDEKYSGFQYNQTKCARDVGYILDAVRYDILYGGNSQTYHAALTYWTAVGSIIANQEPQTAAAYNYLKSELVNLLDGTSATAATKAGQLLDIVVDFVEDGNTTTTSVAPTYSTGANFVSQNQYRLAILDREQVIKDSVILFLGTGRFNVERCRRDTDIIINAIIYDMMYQGNFQTKRAAEAYYGGGKLQNKEDEKQATVGAYNYLDILLRKIVQMDYVRQLQNRVQQNVDLTPATQVEVNRTAELCDVLTDIIANGYTCVVTLDAKFNITVPINTTMSFHQLSIISASGHTFEWVGAGTDINAALPYQGGVPIAENQTIAELGGVIYFTSTDQNGDFKIGTDLTIERDSGNIVGRSFSKSLLAVITPYILALEGG